MPVSLATVPDRRVALAHDYLLVLRGAERTFSIMSSIWPSAPIYTLLHDPAATNGAFDKDRVHASGMRRLGLGQRNFRRYLPLFPGAMERLHPKGYDLVVSSSSAFAHGIRTDPGATHICYCHTPFRYAWHDYARTVREARWYARPALSRVLRRIREWDVEASGRVTHYIANSQLTRERIADFWGRDATVIHPPVDVSRFHVDEPGDYFLVVAELTSHKRVEVALEAAVRAGQPMKVVGAGPELKRLHRTYGSTAQFLGRVSEQQLVDLYARARALVVPNVEEFGIAAVEAQASGRPVLGGTVGGTCETVIDGETGVLVIPENVGALAEAMSQVDFNAFSTDDLRRHAARFSAAAFKDRFAEEVARLTGVKPSPAGQTLSGRR
jgi:glycosyltransferase involved in cell wall biosynthesis